MPQRARDSGGMGSGGERYEVRSAETERVRVDEESSKMGVTAEKQEGEGAGVNVQKDVQ